MTRIDNEGFGMPGRPKAQASGGAALAASLGGLALIGLFVFLPIFIWFFCRIEPGSGQIAVLVRKTGRDLPSGQIVALSSEEKGIQLEVLAEGRYFKKDRKSVV